MMWRHDIIMFEANFTLPLPNPSCWGYNELECIALRIVIPFGDPLKIELHLSLSQEAERASLYHTSNKSGSCSGAHEALLQCLSGGIPLYVYTYIIKIYPPQLDQQHTSLISSYRLRAQRLT